MNTTQKDTILNKITGTNKLVNRGTYLEPPIMWWQNNHTQLNANNLNKMSRAIKSVQDEFDIASNGIEELFSDLIHNNAGWKSAEEDSAEIFNDYENNQALAQYSSARGLNTIAGKLYLKDGIQMLGGKASSTEGEGTVATSDHQHVIGRWNTIDENEGGPGNKYAFIIGNGTQEDEYDQDGNLLEAHRSNAFTVDWEGSGEFSKNLTVKNNLTAGTNGNDRHLFKGKSRFEHAVKMDSNLGVYGNVKLGTGETTVTINAPTTLNADLNVIGNTCISGDVTLTGKSTLNGDIGILGKLEVNDTIKGSNTISSSVDLQIADGTSTISVKDEHNHLDYTNLDVTYSDTDTIEQKKAKKTVPNAIAKVKSDLIGKTSLDIENLGGIQNITLSSDTIYGAAQFSINLVKSLLNAYILDEDSDDPEARSAIDKLIEIADWIKDDSAGAGKIISDLTNEITRASTAEQTLTDNLNNEVERAQQVEEDLDHRLWVIEQSDIKQIKDIIGNSETPDTILFSLQNLDSRLRALENLISSGPSDPDENVTTTYYVKYEDGESL